MMSTYLLILLAAIAVPAFLTAIGFVKVDLRRAFISILLVALPFLFWDMIATERGDWGFSKEHVLGYHFVGLPLEEILFFFVIPFCCIFLFECTSMLIKEKPIALKWWMHAIPATSVVLLLLLHPSKSYTVLASLTFCAAVIALMYVARHVMMMRRFWLAMGLSYIGFLLVNTALTAPPVVYYDDAAILGLRLGTIPVEDFFYNFALISFLLIMYIEMPECPSCPKKQKGVK